MTSCSPLAIVMPYRGTDSQRCILKRRIPEVAADDSKLTSVPSHSTFFSIYEMITGKAFSADMFNLSNGF